MTEQEQAELERKEQKAADVFKWWVCIYLRKYLELAELPDEATAMWELGNLCEQMPRLEETLRIDLALTAIDRVVTVKHSLYDQVIGALNNANEGQAKKRLKIDECVERVDRLVHQLAALICVTPEKGKLLGEAAAELATDLNRLLAKP